MTDEILARLEALANAATKGPWITDNGYTSHPASVSTTTKTTKGHPIYRIALCGSKGPWSTDDDPVTMQHKANAEFIAASRDAVPALIAEVRRLRVVVESAK